MASGGCCDTVFLPHVEHTNIFGLSQVWGLCMSGFKLFFSGLVFGLWRFRSGVSSYLRLELCRTRAGSCHPVRHRLGPADSERQRQRLLVDQCQCRGARCCAEWPAVSVDSLPPWCWPYSRSHPDPTLQASGKPAWRCDSGNGVIGSRCAVLHAVRPSRVPLRLTEPADSNGDTSGTPSCSCVLRRLECEPCPRTQSKGLPLSHIARPSR